MQLASCSVNLAGDLRHVVFKDRVTIAEIIVLRAIHGQDAVRNIKAISGRSGHMIGNVAEKERLIDIYGRSKDGLALIEQLFPGYDPRMPSSLKDLGIADFDD